MSSTHEETGLKILSIKWNGKEYKIENLLSSCTVLDLKKKIWELTRVLPERQKIMGLKYNGKPATDEVLLTALGLKESSKIMMMGTPEEEISKITETVVEYPDIVNDFDIEEETIEVHNREEYLKKIEKRIKTYQIYLLNMPRPNSKLLVLDVDYTLFDHKSVGETGNDLMRPYLHEFLSHAYSCYDIVIWSATSMIWIKAKMEELGMLMSPNFKLCFILDNLAMITVDVPKYGIIEVKPLAVIWGRFPQWGPHNTIMFDDLRRNFLMNPQSGLKIRPYKNAYVNRKTDKELKRLTKYLHIISSLEDFSGLDHKHWERYCRHYRRNKRRMKEAMAAASTSAAAAVAAATGSAPSQTVSANNEDDEDDEEDEGNSVK